MVGKSSKKGWRSVKLADELKAQAENEHLSELVAKGDTLFSEDTAGSSKGVSKKLIRELSLLNKASTSAALSSEKKLLDKFVARATAPEGKEQPVLSKKRKSLGDMWADAPSQKLKTLVTGSVVRRESFAPAVVPAGAALSVNPSPEILESAILQAAEAEVQRTTKQVKHRKQVAAPVACETAPTSEAAPSKTPSLRKTKAQKLKEIRHKQMLREHEIKREKRAVRKALQDKAGREAREALQAEARERKLKIRAQRVLDEAAGKFTLSRGAGGRILKEEEVVPSAEVATSLRRLIPKGDPVLERRASLLKRRMIEQVPELNREYKEKVRFAHWDAKKAVRMVDKDARQRCVLLG